MNNFPTLIESLESNDGARSITRVTFPAGATALRHYHTEYRETFKVNRGVLTVMKDRERYIVKTGQLSPIIEMKEIHAYKNDTKEDVEVEIILEPGHLGCEQANMIIKGIVEEGKFSETKAGNGYSKFWIAFYEITNTIPVGIPGFLFSLLKLLYGRKSVDAYKKNLIDKYAV